LIFPNALVFKPFNLVTVLPFRACLGTELAKGWDGTCPVWRRLRHRNVRRLAQDDVLCFSAVKPWRWNLRQEIVWATLCLVSLLASVCFSLFHLRTKRARLANWLGTLSVFFSIVPILYIFHSEFFPQDALIEAVVLVGGAGGSLLAALGVGLVGSRW